MAILNPPLTKQNFCGILQYFLQVGLQPKASQRSEDTAGPLSLVGPQVSPAVGGYALYGHEVHFTLSVCFPYQVVHKDSV